VTAATVAPTRSRSFGAWTHAHRIEVLAALVALAPIVVAVVRAIANDYVPIGDDGLILLRSRDVLTANHPWLGTWSSSSLSLGVNLNNPGPLLFDLMAVPTKVLGAGPGLAIGVGLVNGACLVGAAAVSYRIAGRRGYVLTLLVGSLIVWSMGSELIFDVWQPHVLVLPYLLLAVLAWAAAEGRVWTIPGSVALVSLLVQTHLSYVYLAPLTLVAGVALHLAHTRDWRSLVRPLIWSVPVALVLWAQTLWQQVQGPGPSNLARLVDAASGRYGSSDAIGLGLATRLVGAVVALPPWILRPSFADSIPAVRITDAEGARIPVEGLPGFGPAALGIVVVLGLLVAVIVRSRGPERRPTRSAGVLAAVLVVVALGALTLMPVGAIGLASHQMRWLWPIGAIVLLAILLGVTDRVATAPALVPVIVGVLALVAALSLPTYVVPAGQTADRDATPSVRRMVARLDALRGRGVLLFDPSTLRFAEPYSGPLLAGLAVAGIPFVTADDGFVHQLGEGRRFRCTTATASECGVGARMTVVSGPEAAAATAGSLAHVYVAGITRAEARELAALEVDLRAAGVRFDGYGVPRGVPARQRETADRYRALQRARDIGSVAVVLTPLP
jgi:hypothetical protein